MKTDEEKLNMFERKILRKSMAQAVSTGYGELNTMMNCVNYTKSLA
jgi:hypothetical protein